MKLDAIAHAITPTATKRPHLATTYGARCICGWQRTGLDQQQRTDEIDKHRRYTGAEVVG